jgi:hypothetical protein
MKVFCGFVVLVDSSGVGAAQLNAVRDDARQNGGKVQRRADRLAHFVQGAELIQCVAELSRAIFYPLFERTVMLFQFLLAFAKLPD